MLFSVLSRAGRPVPMHPVMTIRVQPGIVMAAARGKQAAFGQTASDSYAGRTTRGGPAASGLTGCHTVHVAGAGSGNRVPAAHAGVVAGQGHRRSRLAAPADARMSPMRSAH